MKYIGKVKELINYIKEIKKDPRKNGIMMLIIMFIFFFIVVLMVRIGETSNISSKNGNKNISFPFSINKIKKENYHYIYEIQNNDTLLKYEGDNYNDKSIFSNGSDKFYRYGNIFLKDNNGVWVKITDDLLFYTYTNPNNLEQVLSNAMLDSKTEYSNNVNVYNYLISTSTLAKLYDKVDIDISDEPNKISLTTDSDNEVVEIKYEISPYSIYKNYSNTLIIDIKYSNFGQIEEIENP